MSPTATTSIVPPALCGDPSHTVQSPFGDSNPAHATQEHVSRRLCKEPKVLKLRADGTQYTVHASSATIRGGGSERSSSSQGIEAYELALPSLDAAARTIPTQDNSVRLNTPQTANFPGPTLKTAAKRPFRGSRELADSLPFGSFVSWWNPLYTPTNQVYTPTPFPSDFAGNDYGCMQRPKPMDPTAMLPSYHSPPAVMAPSAAMQSDSNNYPGMPSGMPPSMAVKSNSHNYTEMPRGMPPSMAIQPQKTTTTTTETMREPSLEPKITAESAKPATKPVTTISALDSDVKTRVKKVKDRGVRTRTMWKPSEAAVARKKAEDEWVDVGEEVEGKEDGEGHWTLL